MRRRPVRLRPARRVLQRLLDNLRRHLDRREDGAPGAGDGDHAARLVGDLDQGHTRGLADMNQPPPGGQRPALRHDGAQELERDLGRCERRGRRQGGLDGAAERRVHQDAERGAGHHSLGEQQPVGHWHGERHAARLASGGHEPEQVPDRRAETAVQRAAEHVKPGQRHEIPGVGVETADRFFPDRQPCTHTLDFLITATRMPTAAAARTASAAEYTRAVECSPNLVVATPAISAGTLNAR